MTLDEIIELGIIDCSTTIEDINELLQRELTEDEKNYLEAPCNQGLLQFFQFQSNTSYSFIPMNYPAFTQRLITLVAC